MEADAFIEAIVIDWGLPAALDTKLLAVEQSSFCSPGSNTDLKEIQASNTSRRRSYDFVWW